ncbi:hypothetical protein A2973_02700 [Candidatus Gottesmanbacteria bacterium RIFCSPLOWO2_01_FULL_49_10]|uniref:Uncharacterized protein n=1 Tax=Candidatus Gottesmanbacteria bacterium RIFCSPLOWO2_01_FULL_49_10 TaxID=1798396 RepID=A0A1F6B1L0_9BACT|nr:MAG: hypothetical protein UY10_C0004G0030 [Microgenomates group bacterium GW2011_GWA2_47_8]OGG30808.1 MAG: hypothetical protein A2973_02700 [Candidatus Gottesmanbacteria bacterium RIFCSPLOWO2_01_FULL_49_10]
MQAVFAQSGTELGGRIGGEGLGPFGNIALDPKAGLVGVTSTVSSIVGVMTVAAGIWFIFQFLVGGFHWITSGGDKAKLHDARERITNAFVGLIIVVGGWSILALVGQFFGYDILVSDPGALINVLKIK